MNSVNNNFSSLMKEDVSIRPPPTATARCALQVQTFVTLKASIISQLCNEINKIMGLIMNHLRIFLLFIKRENELKNKKHCTFHLEPSKQ